MKRLLPLLVIAILSSSCAQFISWIDRVENDARTDELVKKQQKAETPQCGSCSEKSINQNANKSLENVGQ